jgi:hypothetical protein
MSRPQRAAKLEAQQRIAVQQAGGAALGKAIKKEESPDAPLGNLNFPSNNVQSTEKENVAKPLPIPRHKPVPLGLPIKAVVPPAVAKVPAPEVKEAAEVVEDGPDKYPVPSKVRSLLVVVREGLRWPTTNLLPV